MFVVVEYRSALVAYFDTGVGSAKLKLATVNTDTTKTLFFKFVLFTNSPTIDLRILLVNISSGLELPVQDYTDEIVIRRYQDFCTSIAFSPSSIRFQQVIVKAEKTRYTSEPVMMQLELVKIGSGPCNGTQTGDERSTLNQTSTTTIEVFPSKHYISLVYQERSGTPGLLELTTTLCGLFTFSLFAGSVSS